MAEVVLLGLNGPDIPSALEPQVTIPGPPGGRPEVMFEGLNQFDVPNPTASPEVALVENLAQDTEVQYFPRVFDVPPPTENPEVSFFSPAQQTGQVIGLVASYYPQAVQVGVSNLPTNPNVTLFTGGAFPPLSLAPESPAPFAGQGGLQVASASDGIIYLPTGTFNALADAFPNQFLFTPIIIPGPGPFPVPGTYPYTILGMRIIFLDNVLVDAALRGKEANLVAGGTATVGPNTYDTFILATAIASLGTSSNPQDRFNIIGQAVPRVTPNIEVILG